MEVVTGDPELASEMISLLNKELKTARSRIKELETNAADAVDIAAWVQRVADAEESADQLKRSLADVAGENQLLRAALEDLQDSKRVKQNVRYKDGEGKLYKETKDQAVGVVDESLSAPESHVKDLESALETYFAKYKTEKSEKKELKTTCKALKDELARLKGEKEDTDSCKLDEISKLRVENDALQRKLDEENSACKPAPATLLKPQIINRRDIVEYMLRLPEVDKRPRHTALRPIYHSTMGLKQYLSADKRTSSCSSNFLFLPGLTAWCPHVHHAFAVGPICMYDVAKGHWTRRSIFDALYGKEFSLFYKWNADTFYAGTYKAIKLIDKCLDTGLEDGKIFERGVSLSSLTDASIVRKSPGKDNGRLPSASTVDQLYLDGILKVEPLGLQCVDFDFDLYDALRARYDELAEVAQYPEDTDPGRPRKIQRTE